MKRFVILTVGKTHSGKTTFAKALEQQLRNLLVLRVSLDNIVAIGYLMTVFLGILMDRYVVYQNCE